MQSKENYIIVAETLDGNNRSHFQRITKKAGESYSTFFSRFTVMRESKKFYSLKMYRVVEKLIEVDVPLPIEHAQALGQIF